jgi:putative intracellular protease/amidase
VTIATFSGKIIKTDSTTLKPDIKLSKVKINDYAGFIFPCMAAGDSIQPEVIDFAKKVFEKGKPMAAQLGSVVILAKAGALKGKKYGFADPDIWNSSIYPELSESIQNGSGVVQDGNIITSGICPWMAKQKNLPDGTTELTQKLILAMNVK